MQKILPEEVKKAVEEYRDHKAVILDVREPEEYDTSHMPGAINVSIKNIEKGQLPDIAKDATIYAHCGSGGRSGRAVLALANHGYKKAYNLGGLRDWVKAGGEITV